MSLPGKQSWDSGTRKKGAGPCLTTRGRADPTYSPRHRMISPAHEEAVVFSGRPDNGPRMVKHGGRYYVPRIVTIRGYTRVCGGVGRALRSLPRYSGRRLNSVLKQGVGCFPAIEKHSIVGSA